MNYNNKNTIETTVVEVEKVSKFYKYKESRLSLIKGLIKKRKKETHKLALNKVSFQVKKGSQ